MGPYNHANATIGRAWGLLSQNLQGGSEPGLTYLGSQGNNYAYNSASASPRTRSAAPGRRSTSSTGFKPDDSTVSALRRLPLHRLHARACARSYWQEHVRNMLRGMDPHESPVFVLDPITARQFIDRGGFDTKEKLIDWVYENATMPAGEYWDYQLIQNYIYPRATFGEEPYATKLKAAAGRDDPDVPAGGDPRRRRRRRDQRLLADHGRRLQPHRLGRRLALSA